MRKSEKLEEMSIQVEHLASLTSDVINLNYSIEL